MFLSVTGKIVGISVIVLVLLFLLFERNIFRFFVKKVSDHETLKEVTDKDINTPSKIYTYKVGGTSKSDKQEIIPKLPLKEHLTLKKEMVNGRTSFSLYFKDKCVGFIASGFINKNIKDILKGAKYHIIVAKIATEKKKHVLYIKIYKEMGSGFDLSATLKKFDYRVGDKVTHAKLGTCIVKEIRMNSVVVLANKKAYEITDFNSLKLITK